MSHPTISQLYEARIGVLDILTRAGYIVDAYRKFTHDSLRFMCEQDCAQILVSNKENLGNVIPQNGNQTQISAYVSLNELPERQLDESRALVYFHMRETVKLPDLITDIYHNANLLGKNDVLIIVKATCIESKKGTGGGVETEQMRDLSCKMWTHKQEGYIVMFAIDDLWHSGLNFTLPKLVILQKEEAEAMIENYNIAEKNVCANITDSLGLRSRFDMQLKRNLVRPGQIVCFERPSQVASTSYAYFVCVNY